jgi:hypothetical protein
LGLNKPPQHRVRHKVWKKQQTDRTRQLLLGADRVRQRTELEMLDGTDIVREVEAAGARHEAAGVGPEAEFGPAAEEEESGEDIGWVDWDEENWIEGTGVDQEGAGAETGAGAEAEAEPAPDESWWEVIYGSTAEGAARAAELDTVLQAFAATVEVDGASGDGHLAKQLGDLGGQKGWRLGLVRMAAGGPVPAVSAVCVVSEGRPSRGRVFRMMALAVDGRTRGQGLATEAMARMKAELLLVAGPRFELRADLAPCMEKGGARFYASQGWSGVGGIWMWRSEAAEVEGALRLLASGEALEQMLQVCEQDMAVTDEVLSDLRRTGLLAGKRKRGEELAGQAVRHSLWEQDSLEAHNELLFGHLEGEVGALQQRKAEYDEERRLSEGSDSCWSGADSDSDSAAELEVDKEPLEGEGAAVVAAQGGELEGVNGWAPAVPGRNGKGEVEPLRPRGLAPKRLRDRITRQGGRGKQQQRRKGSGKGEAGWRQQSGGKWSMPGSRVDPGGAELELEVGREPPALEDAVVVATPGGEVEGVNRRLAGKRKRRHKLAQQPVRHSLWEQDSLEALDEVLSGSLEGEVRALKRRKADYDEARRQSDGSDSCWSGADSDSDSAAELEVVNEPSALEGAAAEQGEVEPLRPRGLAPKRLRDRTTEQDGRGEQQQRRKGGGKEGAGKEQQRGGKWSMPGFRVDPGGAELVAGRYTVKAVQTQVSLQGEAGRETWLGVDLHRGGGGEKFTGWMHSGELQRRAAGDADWLARLRGRAREGWGVEDHSWVCSGGPAVTGHGLRGAVVGWYLPVLVVAEKKMKRVGGVSVMVLMKRVAIGRTAGGVEQAVRIRCRQEWHRHKLSREQLVGITGQRVRADGDKEVLMVGQEIWEEWTGQTVEDTEWRRQAKGQWRAKEQAVVRRGWDKNEVHDKDKVDRDKVYDRG